MYYFIPLPSGAPRIPFLCKATSPERALLSSFIPSFTNSTGNLYPPPLETYPPLSCPLLGNCTRLFSSPPLEGWRRQATGWCFLFPSSGGVPVRAGWSCKKTRTPPYNPGKTSKPCIIPLRNETHTAHILPMKIQYIQMLSC